MSNIFKSLLVNSNQIAAGLLLHLFPKLFTRPSTEYMKSLGRKNIIAVEIGTDRGYNAKTMLKELDIKMLYLVDPYTGEEQSGRSLATTGAESAYGQAKKELKQYKDKICFIRKFSYDAVNDLPDEIDFIYIDSAHTEETTKKELEIYYPKMKRGGVMAGHDFYGDNVGVAIAVADFTKKYNIELYGKDVDWWFEKQ